MNPTEIENIITEICKHLNRTDYKNTARVSKTWHTVIKKCIENDFLTYMPKILLPKKLKYYLDDNQKELFPYIKYHCWVYQYLKSTEIHYNIKKFDMIIIIQQEFDNDKFNKLFINLTGIKSNYTFVLPIYIFSENIKLISIRLNYHNNKPLNVYNAEKLNFAQIANWSDQYANEKQIKLITELFNIENKK